MVTGEYPVPKQRSCTDQALSQFQVYKSPGPISLGSALTSRQGLALGRGTKCTGEIKTLLRDTHVPTGSLQPLSSERAGGWNPYS